MMYIGDMTFSNNAYLTISEFAQKLKISRQTVVKMIKEGIIEALKLSTSESSHYRIKESEIEKLYSYKLENRQNPEKNPALKKLHQAWYGMLQRCNNPKTKGYRWYGAKGIKVCERWEKWENFLDDMGDCPKRYTLERLDNSLGYSPENCVWADYKTQGRNRSNVKLYECEGKKVTLGEYAKLKNISYRTLISRRLRGLPTEQVLSLTRLTKGRKKTRNEAL